MKPVVSALNAWSWYATPVVTSEPHHHHHHHQPTNHHPPCHSVVISVFAIVILSVIGSLFQVRIPILHISLVKPIPNIYFGGDTDTTSHDDGIDR